MRLRFAVNKVAWFSHSLLNLTIVLGDSCNSDSQTAAECRYFLPQWHRMMTVAQPGGVMCSTNRINGVDACMNPTYLQGFLRERFNFTGFVVTDGGSCGNPNCRATVALLKNASAAQAWGDEGHELAAELCLSAGADIELGATLTGYAAAAIANELIPEWEVGRSNTRLYTQMLMQGHLEADPRNDPLGPAEVDTPHSRQLAFEAATDAMVLLKNEGNLLPLLPPQAAGSGGVLKIALIGPHLNSTADLLSSHGCE